MGGQFLFCSFYSVLKRKGHHPHNTICTFSFEKICFDDRAQNNLLPTAPFYHYLDFPESILPKCIKNSANNKLFCKILSIHKDDIFLFLKHTRTAKMKMQRQILNGSDLAINGCMAVCCQMLSKWGIPDSMPKWLLKSQPNSGLNMQ